MQTRAKLTGKNAVHRRGKKRQQRREREDGIHETRRVSRRRMRQETKQIMCTLERMQTNNRVLCSRAPTPLIRQDCSEHVSRFGSMIQNCRRANNLRAVSASSSLSLSPAASPALGFDAKIFAIAKPLGAGGGERQGRPDDDDNGAARRKPMPRIVI